MAEHLDGSVVAMVAAVCDEHAVVRATAISAANPSKRIADPAEIAGVVRFLVSEESSFVNGAAIVVDGGPGACDYTGA